MQLPTTSRGRCIDVTVCRNGAGADVHRWSARVEDEEAVHPVTGLVFGEQDVCAGVQVEGAGFVLARPSLVEGDGEVPGRLVAEGDAGID